MYKVPPALAPLASISGRIYEAVIRARNCAYSREWLSQCRLPGPVISIGNLTLGGSGKTPLTVYIGQTLSELGFPLALLSRGYGRTDPRKSWILSPGQVVPYPDTVLGDEPALMRRYLPHAWMGISGNRYRSGIRIAKLQPAAVFLLDDGFQHRSLHRNLDIVIIDPWQSLETNRIFPAGTLREPVSELRRCHLAVINGRPETEISASAAKSVGHLIGEHNIFFCVQSIQTLIPFSSWQDAEKPPDDSQRPRSIYLVTAVGNPARFQQDIRQLGIEVRGANFFRDHYRLRQRDWDACVQQARMKKAEAIVTTEKDAIKLSQGLEFPLHVAVQKVELYDEKRFRQALMNTITNCPSA